MNKNMRRTNSVGAEIACPFDYEFGYSLPLPNHEELPIKPIQDQQKDSKEPLNYDYGPCFRRVRRR
jgi:hypothetical protein